MNQSKLETKTSTRSRVRALGKLATVVPLAAIANKVSGQPPNQGKAEISPTGAPKKLTTGQYFAAILLSVTPSALGIALNTAASKPNPTLKDWIAALPDAGDTPEVNAALTKMLQNPAYTPIFTTLLASHTVSAPDGTVFKDSTGAPVPMTFAPLVKNLVWNDNRANLAAPWSTPPHPRDGDLLSLIKLLGAYQEKPEA